MSNCFCYQGDCQVQIQPEIAMSSFFEQRRCLSWSSQMEREPAPVTLSAPPTFGCCASCFARELLSCKRDRAGVAVWGWLLSPGFYNSCKHGGDVPGGLESPGVGLRCCRGGLLCCLPYFGNSFLCKDCRENRDA